MTIIYVLIPIAIILTGIGIYLFFYAVKTDQFNDLEKQGMSILFDDDKPDLTKEKQPKNSADKSSEESEYSKDKAQQQKQSK